MAGALDTLLAPNPDAIDETSVHDFIKNTVPGATITSGFRTVSHNEEVGGVPGSLHTRGTGEAVDIRLPYNVSPEEFRNRLKAAKLPVTEFLVEKDHVHWGWGAKGRAARVASASPAEPGALDTLINDPVPAPAAANKPPSAKGGALDQLVSPDPHDGETAYQRINRELVGSLMTGTADVIDTLNQPGIWLLGPEAPGSIGPTSMAQWLKDHAPKEKESKGVVQGATDITAGVVGGAIPGIIEYTGGVPFAVLHGFETAKQQAIAEGKPLTFTDQVHDVITEAVGRKLMGVIGERPFGRVTRALGFGAVAGIEDIAEHKGAKQSAIDAGVNMVIGAIAPELTPGEKARIDEAKAAAQRGDGKGAMRHLDPILQKHADKIAEAARTASQAIRPDYLKLTDDTKASRDAKSRAERRWKNKSAKTEPEPKQVGRVFTGPEPEDSDAGKPIDMVHTQEGYVAKDRTRRGPMDTTGEGPEGSTASGEAGRFTMKEPPGEQKTGVSGKLPAVREEPIEEEGTRTRIGHKDVKRNVDANLALRIGQAAHFTSVMKARMEGWENRFRGMSSIDRMDLISKYQKGGVEEVPAEWKPFFEDFEQLHNEIATSEHAAGIEYEFRDHYVTGMWKDRDAAEQVFGNQKYRVGVGKPGFTKEKVFETYTQGLASGLEPLTTNPAVIAAYRAEASAMAMTRVLAVKDMVDDGFAIPVEALKEPLHKGPFANLKTQDWAGAVERDIGGSRYLLHPEAARLMDWALQMDRQALAPVLGLSPNGDAMATAAWFGRAWMFARNATIPIKLALSAFHALHVMGIEAFQPLSAALTQTLNRRLSFADFQKAIADSDQHGTLAYGRKLADVFKKPIDQLTPQERLELNIMNLGGFNPAMPSVYEVRAEENWRRLWNDEVPRVQEDLKKHGGSLLGRALKITPAMAEAAVLSVGRLSESFQGPMFREWIPSLKAASYMNEAKLTLVSRPELLTGTPEANAQLRQAMRGIQKSIDNRFGEMQYDTVFMPRVIRMGLMGSMLSVGWNFGFLREFGGALADAGWLHAKSAPAFVKPAIKGEISNRIVYASVYTMGSLIFGGMMTYMLSGKIPESMSDLIYPLLPDGSRINTMFFTREFGALYHHIMNEGLIGGPRAMMESKLAPLTSSFLEVMNNEDYYGRQIRDPNANAFVQLAQGMEHMATSNLSPISAQPLVQGVVQTPASMAMGFGGFSPAPKYVTRPAINTAIIRSYSDQYPDRPIPYSEVDKFDETRGLKALYRQSLKTNSDADKNAFGEALGRYIGKYADRLGPQGEYLRRALRVWAEPDNAQQFKELDRATQEKILREAKPEERAIYLPYAHKDVQAKFQH